MIISINDDGSGISQKFAQAIGATVSGRFIYIPESMGTGYLTGFSWGKDLRMMIRNFHLREDVYIERTNDIVDGQEDVIFLLSGIFPTIGDSHNKPILPEQGNVMICMHAVSAIMTLPSNTLFGSVTLAVSRQYLRQLFGKIQHPIVGALLNSKDHFVYEMFISPEIIRIGSEMLEQPIPEIMESHFYKLKCEELLCYIFALLLQRDAAPVSNLHIDDIKAVYQVKNRLLSRLSESPNIASLARETGISEPKLRKLFRLTFGKGVFEYYQAARMHEAARLIKETRLTVSEAGYRLGFTNLSHFSRVFERYIGIKPKKYSASQV